MTPSEQMVFDLCRRTALSLWSYASPRRPDGRELCDALVVFGHHLVVFSVKEIKLSETADPSVAAERWTRKAVDASIQQLAGADRELKSMTRVIRQDGSEGIALPPTSDRTVHFVAVAVGGQRKVPFQGGTTDFGYVHAIDEVALRIILGELDTASDFVEYLDAKEAFKGTILCEGEENLFAAYLHQGRRFSDGAGLMVAEEGNWDELCKKPEFIERKTHDKISYFWDKMIETFVQDYAVSPELGPSSDEHELVVRTLASENRFCRRMLSAAFLDWLQKRQRGTRNVASPSGVGYVFGTYPRDYERRHRYADLEMRCFVARSPSVLGKATIVGLGTEIYDPSGYSMDAVYLKLPTWTDADEAKANEARQRFDVMRTPVFQHLSAEEFPQRTDKPPKGGR